MGKFDGYLICSDLDGTFTGGEDVIVANSKAVKYFTDNGGKFTFITGRTASYLPEQEFFWLINAPAGVFNGGLIYDYQNEKTLRESRLEFKLGDFVDLVNNGNFDFSTVGIYNDCFAPWQRGGSFEEYKDEFSLNMIKIVCAFNTIEEADEFKSFALKQDLLKNTFISKSWPLGVEFNSVDGTKGHAIQFIKNYLGNIHTSIGIGDFENDVKLMEYADIGVATGNAVDSVKQAADMIVNDCKNYAVKDLIEIIESRI
ncbi:MAG: HAD-IIB family hydrolase [Clostridia bacterium]|nr:HAD-IIB family hydrolase [Clostridia bacterium]